MAQTHHIGQRISYDGALCTVRYIGPVAGQTGSWLGVEWDDASRGKHDGSHKGVRYFTCVSKLPTAASLVRPSRPVDKPQSFISALHEKYAAQDDAVGEPPAQIVISGSKVAEEMGFDKIRRSFAQLRELKVVILDGMRIYSATTDGAGESVGQTCPRIKHLDMSRNLFESLEPVAAVCRELPVLRTLVLNGNRFHNIQDDPALRSSEPLFQTVEELSIEDGYLSWEQLGSIARRCPSLQTFNGGTNQLSVLPSVDFLNLSATLTSLYLEFNEFTALSDLANLTPLTALRNLHLKGNSISALSAPGSAPPVFTSSLTYLDISYNDVQSWSFVDGLPALFPGLTALRLSHNPVYDEHESDSKASSSEETHMFTIARLASLRSLNFTRITTADRTNAEMFYLSRIAKQLADVAESAEATVLALHPRYKELCDMYGEPDVIRRQEINPAFLEARLVKVTFHHPRTGQKSVSRIPKSFDIYAVKGIAGKLFSLTPLQVDLIWETGEWDPVGGYDDREDDSSDDEGFLPADPIADLENRAARDEEEDAESKPGRWVKREVRLKEGPRQLGYCVDGVEVVLRIETT
ncbi:hypothetical protein S40293_05646 [Stachybotrys chartarum IBT 40293]|nr:hypothetical protein S40293_05646 [Stachybotrys chartarum IBT 40293]